MTKLLDGIQAKLYRTQETLENLNREIIAFLEADPSPYKMVGEHHSDGLYYALVAYQTLPVPLRFGVLAGEIIHHLRSILDHLVYAAIIHNGEQPTRNSQFPICLTADKFEDACRSGLIKGVSHPAEQFIRSVQPYTSPTPDRTLFAALHELDIADKHRVLVPICTVGMLGDALMLGGHPGNASIVGMEEFLPVPLSENGAKVFEFKLSAPAPKMHVDAKFAPQIAIQRESTGELLAVVKNLNDMLLATCNATRQMKKLLT